MTVEKVSLAVQLDGKTYFVALDQERLRLVVKMAEGLSDTGKLPVVEAPEDFKITPVTDLLKENHQDTTKA